MSLSKQCGALPGTGGPRPWRIAVPFAVDRDFGVLKRLQVMSEKELAGSAET